MDGKSCQASDNPQVKTMNIVQSSKCRPDEVCCTSKNECVNRGGVCEAKEGFVEADVWPCRGGGTCNVPQNNVLSYRDYIQFSGGPGFLVTNEVDNFLPKKEIYAIMFREDIANTLEFKGGDFDGIVIDELRDAKTCGTIAEGLKK